MLTVCKVSEAELVLTVCKVTTICKVTTSYKVTDAGLT